MPTGPDNPSSDLGAAAFRPPLARAIVVGYRKGLCAALERLGTEFALWDRTPRRRSGAVAAHISEIPSVMLRKRYALSDASTKRGGPSTITYCDAKV